MIKNFEKYINEDYFSKLASRKDNGDVRKENQLTEEDVRDLIRLRFERFVKSITIRYENSKPIVDIDGNFYLRRDIEEIPFQFGKVTGDFNCANCKNLTSLEGCPEKVGGDFICSYCDKLTSLEGCPKEVGEIFYCNNCDKLTSLEGCPEKVNYSFYCSYCGNLTSLEGCPEKVGYYFDCSSCKNLISLEGCPKEVGKNFDCGYCGKQFTEKEVKSLCNVKGEILV